MFVQLLLGNTRLYVLNFYYINADTFYEKKCRCLIQYCIGLKTTYTQYLRDQQNYCGAF